MELIVTNPKHAVLATWEVLLEQGEKVEPRGLETLEILNYSLTILEPWHSVFEIPGRELKPAIGAMELCGLVGQVDIDSAIRRNSKAMAMFQDEGVTWGAYGPRIRGLLNPLVDHLLTDPSSRRAVLTIHDSRVDLGRNVKDIPCTLSFQWLIRDGLVHMRTSMRSNDAWLGLPYDLMMFCGLHRSVAHWLGLRVGTYTHAVGSMHLYEKHIVQAADLTVRYANWDPDSNAFQAPPWCFHEVGYAVEFCQDMVSAQQRTANTELEQWIVRSIA